MWDEECYNVLAIALGNNKVKRGVIIKIPIAITTNHSLLSLFLSISLILSNNGFSFINDLHYERIKLPLKNIATPMNDQLREVV